MKPGGKTEEVGEVVQLSRRLLDEMIAHCLAGRPNEACGLLASNNGEIVKVFQMSNASASPMRYSLDPKEQLAAYLKIDDSGWELAGVFHSHTHTEAYPSPTDVREAVEDVPYLILSLAPDPIDVRAFRINKQSLGDETGEVQEVPIQLSG